MAYKILETLRAALEKMGATLDAEPGSYTFNCDAPAGYVWKSTGTTTICHQWDNGSQQWLTKAVKEAVIDLRSGLELLEDETHRAMIENDQDAEWRAPAGAPAVIAWPGM